MFDKTLHFSPNDTPISSETDLRKIRNKFFLKLHSKLSKKHRTKENHLSPKKISFIRTKILGEHLTRKQLVKFIEKQMFKDESELKEPLVWYLRLNKFVKESSNDVWNDVIQKTEYDKR